MRFPKDLAGQRSHPGSWYLGGLKTSEMTSGALSMCSRRTSSGVKSRAARRRIGSRGPVASRPFGKTFALNSGLWDLALARVA
jgi:hypothetical protein